MLNKKTGLISTSSTISDGESWINGKDGYRELVSLNPAAVKSPFNGGASSKLQEPIEEVKVSLIVSQGFHKHLIM